MKEATKARHLARIPALLKMITKAKSKKQTDRAESCKAEYERRYAEMKAAGLENEVKKAIEADKPSKQ